MTGITTNVTDRVDGGTAFAWMALGRKSYPLRSIKAYVLFFAGSKIATPPCPNTSASSR
jgi:hypothetical protein